MNPVLVDPFLGAGGTVLGFLSWVTGAKLDPPVSWMGGKRRLALEGLAPLDLPRRRIPMLLADASWWGLVWPVCLDAVTGPRVAAVLRSWRGEDPRALWFRLRDEGPREDAVEAAAQLLWLQARAASGVPVWWEGRDYAGPGYNTGQRARDARRAALRAGARGDRPADSYRATQLTDRLVQWAENGGTRQNEGKGFNAAGAGGIVDPGTIAARLDTVRGLDLNDVAILHVDALTLTREWAPRLGVDARVTLDPPYQGCTGYPVACPRDEVLDIAETWARHGARVVLHEAVGLAGDLGGGWTQRQLRTGRKAEWITCYGCHADVALPPLLRMASGAA